MKEERKEREGERRKKERRFLGFPEKLPRVNFRDQISETKFPVPNYERNRKKFSVSFPKTGTGKSRCLV
jgi:hypothetical protein